MADEGRVRVIHREKHTLPPQRWRLVAILTDIPEAGETHLTKDEIQEELEKALDLPAGLTFEVGTIEMAAKGSS